MIVKVIPNIQSIGISLFGHSFSYIFNTDERSYNVSPAEWTSVPTPMHCLRARLAETLMSIGDQISTRIFTVDQTHFAAVVGCHCCGFRRYASDTLFFLRFNSIIQLIFVGMNIFAAFRNRNVVSWTCLHRVCLLLKGEWEYTLSGVHTDLES